MPSATSVKSLLNKILSKFPVENLTYCFAYGSGVLKQMNNDHQKNMIDFILAVDSAEKWHECNLQMNPSHYSYLSLFGSRGLARVQTNIPSRVYFNSMIPIKDENVVIKYGVITQSDLIADLLDWNDLYVAGRLHKPVKVVHKTSSEDLLGALQVNLQSAVHASLLLLPENFSEIQFYKTLASLSYTGDFRMKFGEDKNKIDNIVNGGLQKFRSLYAPILKMMEEYVEMPTTNSLLIDGERSCRQDVSPSARHFHLNHLPRTPQRQLVRFWNKGSRNRQDTEDVLRAMAFDQDCGEIVQSILSEIVRLGNSFNKIAMDKSLEELAFDDSETGNFNADVFGPKLPPHFKDKKQLKCEEDMKLHDLASADIFRNQEENHVKHHSSEETLSNEGKNVDHLIGPKMPDHLKASSSISDSKKETELMTDFDEDCNFGPSPSLMAEGDVPSYYNSINVTNLTEKNVGESHVKREAWMTELPQKKAASFGLQQRHFKTRVPTDKESDDSLWTEIPGEKNHKEFHKKKKDHKEILTMKRLKERDREMEKLAKKIAKKRKKESLLEIHLKCTKKKEKKKKRAKNEKKEENVLPARRPFDRNVDLQIRKFDEGQKRAILSKSKFLNDRFAPGQSKFL